MRIQIIYEDLKHIKRAVAFDVVAADIKIIRKDGSVEKIKLEEAKHD